MTLTTNATPLVLTGDPRQRGRGQATAATAGPVVEAIARRLAERETLRQREDIRGYLDRQWEFAATNCGEEFAEMIGVAEGYDVNPRDLFDFLHLGIIADLARADATGDTAQDGCSAWALSASDCGPAVGKNRDFRGEHAGLQRVFLHANPSWPKGRKVLCIGSLGAPGAYSSGMNSDGLALADTQIATTDHGIGWLRYFLMTRLLARHATVAEALADIDALSHAGGGSLVMADAQGALATVDLGHRRVMTQAETGGWIARTNHFGPGSVPCAPDSASSSSDSRGRLRTLHQALESGQKSLAVLRQVMASHDGGGLSGLCRHAEGGDSKTLSGAVFACRERLLYFSPGNPCETEWVRYAIE